MKLLLDENLSRRLLPQLEPHFPNSSQVCLVGLERATDLEIWAYAKTHEYTIVTCDSDFHELGLLYGAPPKIVWLQAGNIGNRQVATLLITAKIRLLEAFHNDNIHFVELG